MYRVIAMSIGSNMMMRKGRASIFPRRWSRVPTFLSIGAQYLLSPVSWRSFLARRTRSTGLMETCCQKCTEGRQRLVTYAYVSGKVKMVMTSRAAAKQVSSQNIQRQETPAFAMKPLQTGPSVGPANGAIVKNASALPRTSASHMSEMTAL